MLNYIGNQFKKPTGLGGKIVSWLMKKHNINFYYKMIPKLNIQQGDNILEIGFGHGLGANMICSQYDCIFHGIDFSELMYQEAVKRNKKFINKERMFLNFGNYIDFPFEQESFEKIFFINVIYFWDNLEQAFKKLKSELRPSGMLMIYMSHQKELDKLKFTKDYIFNKYSIEFVVEKLKLIGFKDVEYFYDGGYYIQARK